MNEADKIRPLLTISQVAEYFQVTERTIRRWVREEGMPSRKGPRFDLDEVDSWSREQASPQIRASA